MATSKKPRKTKLERLEAEGIVDSAKLTDAEKAAIEKLSAADISHLIRIKKKIGQPTKGRHLAKPNIYV